MWLAETQILLPLTFSTRTDFTYVHTIISSNIHTPNTRVQLSQSFWSLILFKFLNNSFSYNNFIMYNIITYY